MLVRASAAECSLNVALPSLEETRVLQGLLAATGFAWGEARARRRSAEDGDGYHVCAARLAAPDRPAVLRLLDGLGANLAFLSTGTASRRCLRNSVDGTACLEVLRWAAEARVGPRALLQLGGERLVYEAIEHAAPSPLRYGQRLDEIVGRPAAAELMRFVAPRRVGGPRARAVAAASTEAGDGVAGTMIVSGLRPSVEMVTGNELWQAP